MLARRNAMRNPRRTAGAAVALLIGVGVVTVFTVLATSLRASTVDNLRTAFLGDLALSSSQFGSGGMSPQLATDLSKVSGVRAAVGVGGGSALVGGSSVRVAVADPATVGSVLRVDAAVGRIGAGQLAVSDSVARKRSWALGSAVPVQYADGGTQTFTVAAIYPANPLLGDYLIPERTWRVHTAQYLDSAVYLAVSGDLAQVRPAVTAVAARYGAPAVRDQHELVDSAAQSVTALLKRGVRAADPGRTDRADGHHQHADAGRPRAYPRDRAAPCGRIRRRYGRVRSEDGGGGLRGHQQPRAVSGHLLLHHQLLHRRGQRAGVAQ
jgi:putative ABC transport system permease protein